MIDLNAPSRRDPQHGGSPLSPLVGEMAGRPERGVFPPPPDFPVESRPLLSRLAPITLITSIALLALGAAAWVLS